MTARSEPIISHLVHLDEIDVDTDQIVPAAFLKTTSRDGLGAGLFAAWRDDPAFVLNRPAAAGARILLAGHNFGCGSSREHAVWALVDHGFAAVISTAFADIFAANAGKNGLLTVTVAPDVHQRLARAHADDPSRQVTIDLETATLRSGGDEPVGFDIDPFVRACMLDGVDALGYLLERLPAIERWERERGLALDTRSPDGRP